MIIFWGGAQALSLNLPLSTLTAPCPLLTEILNMPLNPLLTRKPKHLIDKLEWRLVDTWDRMPQGIVNEAMD